MRVINVTKQELETRELNWARAWLYQNDGIGLFTVAQVAVIARMMAERTQEIRTAQKKKNPPQDGAGK